MVPSVVTLVFSITFATFVQAQDPAASKTTIGPERLKFALAELEKITNKTLKDSGVPGIGIVVVHQDKIVYKQGFGVREAGKPEKIDADTVFQVASVSKPISSTVMAALVGEKKVGWDDRVVDHDDTFRLHSPYVTEECRLRDLLCHRSGLPDHCGDFLEDLGYDVSQILHRLRYLPLDGFRNNYAYTNFGYSEACYAAAKAVNQKWADVGASKLFKPLGMNSTSYLFADYEKAKNRALIHVKVDGKWVPKNTRRPDAQMPAGGVSSTLNDLARWLRLQLAEGKFDGKQIIAAEALAETHKPQFVTGYNQDTGRVGAYCLGWNTIVERGSKVFWKHSGGFSLGLRSEVAAMPEYELGIIVLSNAGPTGIPEGLVESFFDLVLDGKLNRDWVEFANRMFDEETKRELGAERDYSKPAAKPNPALALSAYAGKYQNDFFGPIEIVEKSGALVLRMGPKPLEFPLKHWERDDFTYQPVGEMAGGLSGVCFSVAPDGKADRVLIENINVYGQGAFARAK